MRLRSARWLQRAFSKSPTSADCVSDLSPSPRPFEWSASGAGRVPVAPAIAPAHNQPTVDTPKALRLLVVEDSPDDTLFLVRELRRGGYAPSWERVDTPAPMTEPLNRKSWDRVVADS